MIKKVLNAISQKVSHTRLYLMEILNYFHKRSKDDIRVNHGAEHSGIGGPLVKLRRMQHYFPNVSYNYNIIYSVSAKIPPAVCGSAKKRGVKIVQHINSIFHPAYRGNYIELNAPFKKIYNMADHIVFGSNFARDGAVKYFGECDKPSTIVYNGVDLSDFAPVENKADRINILVIGVHYIRHRIEPVIQAMPYVLKEFPKAKLLIAGPLKKGRGIFDCSRNSFTELAQKLGVINSIEFYPQYTQKEAPEMYALADVMVHLKHMDWTPNTVIEAMACGTPVLHTGNGGLPEIVGDTGLSLDLPLDWERIHTPDPVSLADKITALYEKRKEKGTLARTRAVELFNLEIWAQKHQEIFEGLIDS